ncbi:MAG: DUF5724 domain-containing protein [Planctomycetaceae bacterium]
MTKMEAVQQQLRKYRVDSETDDAEDDASDGLTNAFKKLPKNLKAIAMALLDRNESGSRISDDVDEDQDEEKLRAAQRRIQQLQEKLETLSAADRKKIFSCVAPNLADGIEKAWQQQKLTPYQKGYSARAFRAPNDAEISFRSRLDWLVRFLEAVSVYQPESVTPGWLAQWAQHAFNYRSQMVCPILISALDSKSKEGDEVFEILRATVLREHPIGIMGDHVIAALLGSSRPEGWELMEKTLLAAQRQEGLRQSIVSEVHAAHPEAFVRMLRLIVSKDLIRFSSVARSVNLWFGLLWDSVSSKVLQKYVEEILRFIESPSDRKKALQSDQPETVYRALWAAGYEDVSVATVAAGKLLKHKSDEIRYVAAWSLTVFGTPAAERTKYTAIPDENLQVALMAAVSNSGVSLSEEAQYSACSDVKVQEKSTFDLLEALCERLPEKPEKLKPIVWPWTERRIEKSMLMGNLLDQLGDRPATRMLPYLKAMDSWQQRSLIGMLAAQKKWDKLTRSTLFELAGHASANVRSAAFEALEKQSPQNEELFLLEGFLTRKSADVRVKSVEMLLKGKDAEALESSERLLTSRDRNQRLGGLEMLRQMAEAKRSHRRCCELAAEFASRHKKLLKEEEQQLAAITNADREVLTLDDALGLMNPAGRSPIVPPQKKKVVLLTKAAAACLKSLDDLIHEHRETIVDYKSWRGRETGPLGEVRYLPGLNLKKPLPPQLKKIPLIDVWHKWNSSRPAATKDKDGLELLRAWVLHDVIDHFEWRYKPHMKTPAAKKTAAAVMGEFSMQKLKYESLVGSIVQVLFLSQVAKQTFDYLLDCVENSYAQVTDDMNKLLIAETSTKKKQRPYSFHNEDNNDWRENPIFKLWSDLQDSLIGRLEPKFTLDQHRRFWQLRRFRDEPIAGATRHRPDISEVAEACQKKLATRDDLLDHLLGGGRSDHWRNGFNGLQQLTSRPLNKQTQKLLDDTKGLAELVDLCREKILEVELQRGEAVTAATEPGKALQSLNGVRTLFRILAALNGEKFKIDTSYREGAGLGRSASLTHLAKITFPAPEDTAADFAKLASQAVKDGYLHEDRLLELSFLAPQWSKFIEAFLKWDGFSEGLYWFIAHMNTWSSDARDAAADAEGLHDASDDDDLDHDDEADDDDESDDKARTDSIPRPKKLSAWERLLIERTPITPEQRAEGAVDVNWFHRTWKQLGKQRWLQLAQAARFAANSAQAKKAQFLADVLLGNTPRQELVDGIEKKYRKEFVRLLGLLPLATGAKRETDILERYETLQRYKKYARTLSGLTKPDAMRAVEIGFQNLAGLADYPDPLRLEWAMEAESIRDLAKGPVSVTKDGISVTLSIDADAKPQLSIARGDKPLKSIPSATKKKYADIAELVDRGKELRGKTSRIKQSLEAAMCRGDAFSSAELVSLFQHALLAPQISRLVLIGDGIAGYPDKGGKVLRSHNGKPEPLKKNEILRIAHPADLLARGDWAEWQQECFRAERVQPFKQIFRELYVVTKQEKKDSLESTRFAGHQIGPRQAIALWNSRGWNTQEDVFKMFHELSLMAEVSFQYNYGTAADVEGLTLENISFRKRDEPKPLKLANVPPIVFSEVMRDIDLVVSVAHRGEVDPEASASTVEMRSALLRETCDLLGLKNVTLKGHHAIIKGYYGDYSLHLGSGNIHRMPGGFLAILPVHAQHRGRIFLPFADDDPRTAEVISKALLLARDEEILDPMILDQLGAPANRRRDITIAVPAEESKAKSTTIGKTVQSKPASADSGSTIRHLEFVEGNSKKFWEIELNGNTVTTKWGRIGTDGQSKTKTFADESKAKTEYDKLLKEKFSKGYSE